MLKIFKDNHTTEEPANIADRHIKTLTKLTANFTYLHKTGSPFSTFNCLIREMRWDRARPTHGFYGLIRLSDVQKQQKYDSCKTEGQLEGQKTHRLPYNLNLQTKI